MLYSELMYKKIILAISLVVGFLVATVLVINYRRQHHPLSTPLLSQPTVAKLPSETLIDYTDPNGFSFSYPDNLSLTKNDLADTEYGNLQLSSKEVSGSLLLKISDSKYASLDDWVKLNKGTVRPVKLGSLSGVEVRTADRLLLGALDQGIFFSLEMPLIEEGFWQKVYHKILTNFAFVSPGSPASGEDNSGDVTFEGEETVQ